MENCIHQNNAINIYELFFTDCEQPNLFERSHSRTVTVFRDPCAVKRPVTHICWSPDHGSRLAVTHSNLKFQRALPDQSHFSYIWLVGKKCEIYLTIYTLQFLPHYIPLAINSDHWEKYSF